MKIFIYYPLKRGGFKPKFFGQGVGEIEVIIELYI